MKLIIDWYKIGELIILYYSINNNGFVLSVKFE